MITEFSFKRLLEIDRFVEMLHQDVLNRIDADPDLINLLRSFLEEYACYNLLSEEDVSLHYRSFATDYVRDLKSFDRDGLYPIQRGKDNRTVDRIQYDISLILSTLLTGHRFRLMYLVAHHFPNYANRTLSIGCGPALELILIRGKTAIVEGYDVSLNPFCSHAHPDVHFFEKPFNGQEVDTYDAILAIELLEHLSNPQRLLQKASVSLKNGGHILLTTATNVPQFDHVYNFPTDSNQFENMLLENGLKVIYREYVPHRYSFSKSEAHNTFYICRKINSTSVVSHE